MAIAALNRTVRGVASRGAPVLAGHWYRVLSLGGVARVGQVQLLQPFLTLLAPSLFLGERLSITTLGFAVGVVVCVALERQTQISTPTP